MLLFVLTFFISYNLECSCLSVTLIQGLLKMIGSSFCRISSIWNCLMFAHDDIQTTSGWVTTEVALCPYCILNGSMWLWLVPLLGMITEPF